MDTITRLVEPSDATLFLPRRIRLTRSGAWRRCNASPPRRARAIEMLTYDPQISRPSVDPASAEVRYLTDCAIGDDGQNRGILSSSHRHAKRYVLGADEDAFAGVDRGGRRSPGAPPRRPTKTATFLRRSVFATVDGPSIDVPAACANQSWQTKSHVVRRHLRGQPRVRRGHAGRRIRPIGRSGVPVEAAHEKRTKTRWCFQLSRYGATC